MKLECLECGNVFNKKEISLSHDVKCVRCGSEDVDLATVKKPAKMSDIRKARALLSSGITEFCYSSDGGYN